jgi:two-component system response regulator NreC
MITPRKPAFEPADIPAAPRARRALTVSSLPATERSEPDAAGVRVLCVDDHAVLIEGLKAQFSIDGCIRVVGRLPSAEKLLDEVERLRPDVVILDIEMPGPDVFEMADRMRHAYPNLRFIFLSAHIGHGYLAAAYKCGAWGYFAKGDELDDIVAGIKEMARSTTGTFIMGPKVRHLCGAAHSTGSAPVSREEARPTTPLEALSARELEVLRMIGTGLSRVDIAKALSRSAKTIDGHQERMIKKLGVETRRDLMRFAIREGLAQA